MLLHRDGRRGHARQRVKRRFDFAELDPLPADLELPVAAAEILQRPVAQPAGRVARLVEPRAAAKRVGHEPLGRERGRLKYPRANCTPPK